MELKELTSLNTSKDWDSELVGVDLRKPKGDFKKGLITGGNQLQQFGYGAASLLGAAVGSEKLQEAGARGYERQQDDMELNQLRVGRVEDVKGVGDAIDYAQGVVAQLIPNLAPMILGGGVGGLAGKAVIKKQIKKNIGKGMSPGAAACLLYTSPSPRDRTRSRMPSSA